MKPKSTLRAFLVMSGSALFAVTCASAADYYWDADGDGTPGFGSATGTTWSSAGTGNLWSTSPTGDGVGGAAVVDYPTTTADDLYFGTPAVTITGNITISGTVNANSVFSGSVNIAGTTPTINFAAEGSFTRANNNGSFPADVTFTGNGTSLTWKPQRNLNVDNVNTTSAGKIILSTSPTSTFPYPGRTVMDETANVTLGAPDAPLVFDDGCLRLANGFPYETLSDLDADHPVSFTADEDFGLENLNGSFDAFIIDLAINAGTGVFWAQGNRPIILTQANTWGGVNIASGTLQISDSDQLGPIASPIRFGSGFTDLSGGTLIITGTTLSDFGARPFFTTPDKDVVFDIVEAAHTFTLDSVLDMAGGTLTKLGDGTLSLSGTANTYTGVTTVAGGTLALINGSHASAITVSSGASLGFEIGSETTSSASVDLTDGTVTISNPGAVDGSTSYLLMTAAGGFTFTDIATQLGTAVPDYALELQNSDTELWLVYAPAPSGDYSTWATDNGIAGEPFDGDFNRDGISNGIAYALGLSPTASSQPAGVLSGNTITFTKGADAIANSDVTWIIETSETLSGSWLEEVTQVAGDATETISYTFTPGPGVPKQFARLKAVQE